MTFRYIPHSARREMKSPKPYYKMLKMSYEYPFGTRQEMRLRRHICDVWDVSPDEASWLIEFLQKDLYVVEDEIKLFEIEYPEYIL